MSQGGSVWAGSGVSKATPLLVLYLWRLLPLLRRWRAARQFRMNGEDQKRVMGLTSMQNPLFLNAERNPLNAEPD
jgi:hypothetical protein